MIFGRTAHAIRRNEDGSASVRTEVVAHNFRPGAEIEATDGRTYVVTPEGSIVRPGKIKAKKKLRRKARALAREALRV